MDFFGGNMGEIIMEKDFIVEGSDPLEQKEVEHLNLSNKELNKLKTETRKKIILGKNYDKSQTAKENFDLLADFMDDHEFTVSDFLACVCAKISGYPQSEFTTKLMVAGHEFDIKIIKR